jgi:hypothetical protein
MRALVVSLLILLLPTNVWAQAKPAPVDLAARLDKIAADVEELKQLGAEVPAVQKAIADLSAQIAVLRQDVDTLEKAGGAQSDVVARIDRLDQRIETLGEQVGAMRASLQAAAAPESQALGGGTYADGFILSSSDGRFTIRTKGFVQPRYEFIGDQSLTDKTLASGERVFGVQESTFILRRARLAWDGQLYLPQIHYGIQVGADLGKTELLDYFIDYALPGRVVVRAGQFKVPFSIQQMENPIARVFPERALATDEFRYDRDIGLTASWNAIPNRLEVIGGVFNGSGKNVKNDNIDPLAVVRVAGTVLGQMWAPAEGDLGWTMKPALRLGAGATFENAVEPTNYNGTPINNTDVDMNGRIDNVRVLQAGVDAAFRYRGLGIESEGFYRHEDWGGIPDGQTTPFSPDHNKLGGYVEASYYVLRGRLQVGARASYTELSPVVIGGGAHLDPPKADRDTRTEYSALVLWHRFGNGLELGAMYSFINWGKEVGANPSNLGEHRLIVEGQLAF